ncbi:Fic/DOC family protein [Paenibacillus sp. NPDC093718]|uniref:Fic/DOC family protein n=1 Tax=Paenibacillus sp. NPDC093718 TaxID=3390601 RepID=UPI003CFFC363
MSSSYVYPGTNVLINKADLKDQASLDVFERNRTALRAMELQQTPIKGNFDIQHLKAIHQHLFQDVYPFAGEFRYTNIRKNDFTFAEYRTLDFTTANITNMLREDKFLKGLSPEKFADKAATYYSDINYLHPFREGNGRTIREFFRQLANEAGYDLRWSHVPKQEYMAAVKATDDPSRTEELSKVIHKCIQKESESKIMWIEPDREMTLKDALKKAKGLPAADQTLNPKMLNTLVSKFRIYQDNNKEFIQFQLKGQQDTKTIPLEKAPHLSQQLKNHILDQASSPSNAQMPNKSFELGN